MMVREETRRGQILYGSTAAPTAFRKRDTGTRSDTHDDKGRAVMPFDRFVFAQVPPMFDRNVMGLMELAFGGR